ncbi:ABC transporter substrate-binding protein [Luteimonas sp. RIT-PG2_3]
MTDHPMPPSSLQVRRASTLRPRSLLGGVALGGVLMLAGCAKQAPAVDDGSVRIGVATAQTGTLAPFDVPVMRGLRLGIEQLNAAGPTQYVLVEKNVRSDAAQTAIAAQELIDDHVDLLILPCDQDLAIAAAALAADAEVPAFSTCASSPTLAPSGQGWLFGNVPADNMQATASATWAHAQGFRNAAIVQSPDTQYTTLPLYFAQVFKQLGGNVVGDIVYKTGQQNFAAEISRIKALTPAPDVIMTAAYEPDFPAFIRQLRAAGVTAQVIGSDGIDTPTILGLGAAAEGVVYTTAGFAGDDPAYAGFLQQFEQRYGAPSDTVFDAVGYDLSRVIAAAVAAAGPQATPKALRDAIASLSNVKGITSPITYLGTDGMPQREVALVRIGASGRSLVAHLQPDPALVPPPRF